MKFHWKNKLQPTVMGGVFAAVLVVLSQISVPLPTGVPVTLQTFAVALCGYTLGPAVGSCAVGAYFALGAVGVPVFAGFTGGLGSFAGVAGGYLWAFLPMAFLCGLGMGRKNRWLSLLLGAAGLAVCHLCGVLQFAGVMGVPPLQAFLLGSAPYLVKDALSVAGAYFAALAVLKALNKARLVTLA